MIGMAAMVGPLLTLAESPLSAKWIWIKGQDPHAYNQTAVALKEFKVSAVKEATLRITADSWYRLGINGHWVVDGPCRSWPDHYQYDVIDAAPYLRSGKNEITIIARYFGVGDFHRIPQQAGLLAQLDITDISGKTRSIVTDKSWKMADSAAWIRETPKVSIQMEPAELYDARLAQKLSWKTATELYATRQGPWKNLEPRDVALLSLQPRPFRSFLGAKLVRAPGWDFCLPAARLSHPGVIEANHNVAVVCGMATVLENEKPLGLKLQVEGLRVAVDGKQEKGNLFQLEPGRHIIVAMPRSPVGHDKEKALRFLDPTGCRLENPVKPNHDNPFVLVRFGEFAFATNDLTWISYVRETPSLREKIEGYEKATDELLKASTTPEAFRAVAATHVEVLPSRAMFVTDAHWQFTEREVIGDAAGFVKNSPGLIHDNPEITTVLPTDRGDVELCYDLGEQDVGYYDFEMIAEPGVTVDIFGIEYISPDARLQHSERNRNGLRYITKAGNNRFTSLKRRSGRYVFLTLRGHKTPVKIRLLQLVSSTYPIDQSGAFSCSDTRLDRIWEISTRTLKLCMEDTYTDCPLYEQTHWVGDARNESLLGYGAFGAYDLARRCIVLTGHSLERFPIAGCQTPSCWDTLLPAWSFLWGISTWDYYFETGDHEFLTRIYPLVIKNLKGAESLTNDNDLFSGPFWNMFDWTGTDQNRRTVTHNSMFVVGAIEAAIKEAEVLGKSADGAWLKRYRERLVRGINALWDSGKKAYPDSLHDDGKPSPSTSQHTSFLGLLYNIVPAENQEAAKNNLLNPPEKMIRLGSPFAALYMYEAFEKLGLEEEIIKDIYRNYLPMLEAGATTVWESFPSGTTGGGRWPTRSHCHAWSSAPTRFLNRIILGVKPLAPGARSIQISPRLAELKWAQGTTLTKAGPVHVSWKLEDKELHVDYTVPPGVQADFVKNATHEGLAIVVNGNKVP